ncbi:hypothetical protein V2J09_002398 [Rumex salicifolius]
MRYQTRRSLFLLFLLFAFAVQLIQIADAGKRRVEIPDDLDDVVDDEEDEEWREWGKKKPSPSEQFDIPPADLDKMEISQVQEEMMKRHTGPVFGFVKLRLGVQRTPDSVSAIAAKWTKMLKTGGIELKFMGIDLSTIMFNMERGQDKEELKDFILDQSDAYEVKIGDLVFRRPGDPPLEEVIEKLRREKDEAENASKETQTPKKEELRRRECGQGHSGFPLIQRLSSSPLRLDNVKSPSQARPKATVNTECEGNNVKQSWLTMSFHQIQSHLNLREKATTSPGNIMSPKPMTLYPPHGSNIRGIFSNIGMPSSPLLSPRAT